MSESSNSTDRYLLAVITDEGDVYPEVRRHLGGEFRTILSSTEDEIKKILEEPELHAVLFDLDCIVGGPADGLEVLEEMRRVRDDVVFAAFTKSVQRSIPLKASQAGADTGDRVRSSCCAAAPSSASTTAPATSGSAAHLGELGLKGGDGV